MGIRSAIVIPYSLTSPIFCGLFVRIRIVSAPRFLKNLGTRHIFPKVSGKSEFQVCFHRIIPLILQSISRSLLIRPMRCFLPEINEYTPAFLCNHSHGSIQLFAAVTAAGTKQSPGETFGMDTAENGSAVIYIPHGKRHMMFTVDEVHIAIYTKLTVPGRQICFRDPFNKFFMNLSVFNQILNTANLQTFFFCQLKGFLIRHRTACIHDFTAKTYRFKSRHSGQIHSGLCVPVVQELHAFALQGKHMSRPFKVCWIGSVFDRFHSRHGTGCCRNPRSRILKIN